MTTPTITPTGWYPGPSRAPFTAAARPEPKDDPFYKYDAPLDMDAGTVLRTRRTTYHIGGFPTPLEATQLLYRSINHQTGKPTVNVTSVIPPLIKPDKTKVISYQSAYDSLNQSDEPSYAISGGNPSLSRLVADVELAVYGQFLADGYTVIVPDVEGQGADFAAGPEYGMNTLYSIRAAFSKKSTLDLPDDAKVAMLGYSGGALATEWAAELAPTYARDVNERLIGAAMGGLLVHPAHNLHYVEGTPVWGGVMLMALVGIVRAFDEQKKFREYLSTSSRFRCWPRANGAKLFDDMQTKSIIYVLGQYWNPAKGGLKWKDLAKPEYPTPESVPLYVDCANKLIMGTGGVPGNATKPEIPLFIGQGANGEQFEGTPGNKPGIGPGDGVMIAGDVRTLARSYRERGATVWYEQYDELSHISSLYLWLPHSITWIKRRFAGDPAPQSSSIPEGNALDPIKVQSSAASSHT
jgi:pimeloyl-ACP methyl ester carboxylesterase